MAFNGVFTETLPDNPPYGLLSVADVVEHKDSDYHWVNGFDVESDACVGKTYRLGAICEPEPTSDEIFNQSGDPFFKGVGFDIVQEISCANSTGQFGRDGRKRALAKLESVTEAAIETELLTGVSAQDAGVEYTRYLLNAAVVSNTAYKAAVAVGLVEREFSTQNPGVPITIHMSSLIAEAMKSSLKEIDGDLYTKAGSLVTINRSMINTYNPEDATASASVTQDWVYATGPVTVHIGTGELITITDGQAIDPKTNSVNYVAERPAAVYFEGCEAQAALADATL